MQHAWSKFATKLRYMNIKQKHRYTWLVYTIHRVGEISHNDLSKLWENNVALSGSRPLNF